MDPKAESILISIKKLLGLQHDYPHFDLDITMHINSVFSQLHQLGVGPTDGFKIEGKDEVWSSFETGADWNLVKSYVYLKTRLLFDPPQNSFLVNAMEKQISEFEWRLVVKSDITNHHPAEAVGVL